MMMIPNSEWSEAQARRVAELMVNPRTNGGVTVQEMLGAPATEEQVIEILSGLVRESDKPMCLIEDGDRALQISADPYDPNGQAHLHFSNQGFRAGEVVRHLAAFMAAHPTRQWVAIGIRPGLFRLICQPLGFTLVDQLAQAFLATKDTVVSGKVVN